jgi:serine/threonine protein kinase/Tol biopolymer transport system component
MREAHWEKIQSLYHHALELSSEEREAFLANACGGDLELQREIESLLRPAGQHSEFIEKVIGHAATELVANPEGPPLPGRILGQYHVGPLIGSGGMGHVYRAHDCKLGRDVALKTLQTEFALDPEWLARFRREARTLASLNHPNIAAIYELEEFGGTTCLVLELVEGETLQERLRRGPIPMDDALPIAKQIVEALEAAHERGIIHRDLKPANIKLTPGGRVKVLDFGLAKAFQDQHATTLSNSPTLMSASIPGIILGTAAYMSPEQAKGKEADRTSDVWAFACVLYEILTGHAVFGGETTTEILGAVLRGEPDWRRLPSETPQGIRRLLRRCLQKDRTSRLHDIADARIELDEAQTGEVDGHFPQMRARRRSKFWVGFAAVLLLMVIVLLGVVSILYFNRSKAPEIRVEVSTPSTSDPVSFAISPDGRRLVFVASNEGKSQIWIRALDSVAAKPLAGTDGARFPFWSPDSASIGFFADGKLKRIDIVGGAPQVLANATLGSGGTWNRDGTILFALGAGPLFKISAATGGEPVAVTRLETGQTAHRFPQFLPDGQHFVYFVVGAAAQGIYAGSLDGASSKSLTSADSAAVVSPSGFLLFVRQTTLFAQTFDFKRQELSGNPFPVAEQVAFNANLRAPGFSTNSGIVAYRTGSGGGARQLTWMDRSGKIVGTVGAPDVAALTDPELSLDGKRVAVSRTVNRNEDIWLIDAARGVPTRLTFDVASDQRPVWSPDGRRVVFHSNRKGVFNLYWKSSSGAGADELLLESDRNKGPNDWSSDGRFLLFRTNDPQTGFDLWVLPVSGDKKPFPFLKTPFDEREGQFSPDGKWIAYQSNESGRFEIYLQPFPGPGGKFQVSSNGGAQPRWNKNGKEIFYVSLDSKMMAAPVKLSLDGQSLETGTPVVLFPVRIAGGPLPGAPRQQYSVSSDGQRFLVNLATDEGVASPITLIYNWKARP